MLKSSGLVLFWVLVKGFNLSCQNRHLSYSKNRVSLLWQLKSNPLTRTQFCLILGLALRLSVLACRLCRVITRVWG